MTSRASTILVLRKCSKTWIAALIEPTSFFPQIAWVATWMTCAFNESFTSCTGCRDIRLVNVNKSLLTGLALVFSFLARKTRKASIQEWNENGRSLTFGSAHSLHRSRNPHREFRAAAPCVNESLVKQAVRNRSLCKDWRRLFVTERSDRELRKQTLTSAQHRQPYSRPEVRSWSKTCSASVTSLQKG